MREFFRIGNQKVKGYECQPDKKMQLTAHIYRYFHLLKPTKAETGDILKSTENYILVFDREIAKYKIFIGLRATTLLEIQKYTTSKHPITGLAKSTLDSQPVIVPACEEFIEADQEKGFELAVTRYYISGPLDPKSVVNGKTLINLNYHQGITRFEVA